MASASSATELKLFVLRALRVSAENLDSTRLSHDAGVGVKYRCQQERLGWKRWTRATRHYTQIANGESDGILLTTM